MTFPVEVFASSGGVSLMLWKGLGGSDFYWFEPKQLSQVQQALPESPGCKATVLFHVDSYSSFLIRLLTSVMSPPHSNSQNKGTKRQRPPESGTPAGSLPPAPQIHNSHAHSADTGICTFWPNFSPSVVTVVCFKEL